MPRYFLGLVHEQFPPEDLLRQAVEAEDAGFDGVCCSDHFQPWWEPGHSGHAWVWLGAAGQATQRLQLGTAVTPPARRYHPALIAEAFATLERLWKAALVDEYYTDDWHDPRRMQEHAQATMTDDEFRDSFLLGPDPDHHVERIREIEELGATTVVLMNVSGADPDGAIGFYGEHVLPQLR